MHLIIFLAIFAGEVYDPDLFFTPGLLSSANMNGRVMLACISQDGKRPKADLYLFDFVDSKIRKIDDGRILTGVKTSVHTGDLFIVIEHKLKKIFFLTDGGELKDTVYFGSFKDLPANIRIVNASVMDSQRISICYRDLEDMNSIFLAITNLSEHRAEIIHAHQMDEPYLDAFFMPKKDRGWYFVVPETAQILHFDKQFGTLSEIHPAVEPVEIVDKPWLRDLLLKQGSSVYGRFLDGPITGQTNEIAFVHTTFDTDLKLVEMIKTRTKKGFLLKRKTTSFLNHTVPISSYNGQTLVYNLTEGNLAIIEGKAGE